MNYLTPSLKSFAKCFDLSEDELIEFGYLYNLEQRSRKLSWWQLIFISIITLYSKGTRHKDRVAAMIFYFGVSVCENAFSDRLSQLSTKFLDVLIKKLSERIKHIGSPKRREKLQRMIKVLAEDTSLMILDKRAEGHFGRFSTNPKAQAKLYILIDIFTNGCLSSEVSGCKTSEKSKRQKFNRESVSTIELRDRGYFSNVLFAEMVNENRYFITRVNKNWNPKVKSVEVGNKSWVGKYLKDIDLSNYNEIKLIVFPLNKNDCKTKLNNGDKLSLSFIGKRIKGEMKYYLYHIPSEWNFSFDDFYHIYRFRWNVEQIFKVLKSNFNLSKLRLRNENAIINMVKIIIIAYLLSNVIIFKMSAVFNCSEKRFSHFVILSGELGYYFRHILEYIFWCDRTLRKCDWKSLTEGLFLVVNNKKISMSNRNRNLINVLKH